MRRSRPFCLKQQLLFELIAASHIGETGLGERRVQLHMQPLVIAFKLMFVLAPFANEITGAAGCRVEPLLAANRAKTSIAESPCVSNARNSGRNLTPSGLLRIRNSGTMP